MQCTATFFLTDEAIEELDIDSDRLEGPGDNEIRYSFLIDNDLEEYERLDEATTIARSHLESEIEGIDDSHIAAPVAIAYH